MVVDLIFVGAVLLCAILLATGKSLNICIKHTHVVEQQEIPKEPETSTDTQAPSETKILPELIQDILGVTDER